MQVNYEEWVAKYGEEQAKFLIEEMGRWSNAYSHGTLIDFDFTKPLNLKTRVCQICQEKGWSFDHIKGDLRLLEKMLAGDWPEQDFLVVQPGQRVVPSFDETIIKVEQC
jgi:Protein of unknown function (DUF1638)